jgi:outer membrane protein assembly factor BamB
MRTVHLPRRRSRLVLAALGVVAVLVAGAALAAKLLHDDLPGDVSNPDVLFVPERDVEESVYGEDAEWPVYGYTQDHRRTYRTDDPPHGPWVEVWRRQAPALLEFPPVMYRGYLFQLADNAQLRVLEKDTGRVHWKRKLGALSASTPASSGGSVYVSILEIRKGVKRGRIAALRIDDGSIRWKRDLDSRTESSPLLHRGRLYVGTESGELLALNAHNGRVLWRYQAEGAIKGSPTLGQDVLYFGDYGGHVHAVRLRDGRRVWRNDVAVRSIRSGRFYATAAVAFGRVYIGSTDGRMYSLSAADGELAWAKQTGDYVYSSAAVDNVAGLGPTVFFGSYDGNVYALNARSGEQRWRHRSGGRISGSPTIIGDRLYFSDLGRGITRGLRLSDGVVVFKRPYGGFDPVITDGRHLFLTARRVLIAIRPKSRS